MLCNLPHNICLCMVCPILFYYVLKPISFQHKQLVLYHFIIITVFFNNTYLLFFTYYMPEANLGVLEICVRVVSQIHPENSVPLLLDLPKKKQRLLEGK